MEIDMGTAIVGGIMIIICMLPFILIYRIKKKRKRKLLNALNRIASSNKCEIHHYEIINNIVIGVDKVKGVVFFSRQLKNDMIEEKCINLNEVKLCKVNRVNFSGNQIHRLSLGFIPIDKNQRTDELEFFNDDINLQLDGELQAIERWSVFINNQLKTINR